MSNRYPVIDVSSATRDLIEPMGTKRKFWFNDAGGARWLFKYSRPQTGEHWAEKIAAEIGALLEIPVARVELGMCDGSPGAFPADVKPLSSIEAFRTAARLRPEASAFWLARLASVGQDVIEKIVLAVPSELITDLARRFALAVIAWSRPYLLGVSG